MKVATITHDVNGIRMNIDGVVHTWATQSWLAESHAQSMIRCERLESTVKGIRDVLAIKDLDSDEACKRIEKILADS